MPAAAILRLVRIMQAEPRLGILQGLVVGLPSTSAFARLFQFGMRLGMRSYTIGSAWWQGDCGPYWGHNAVVRLAPFIAHCQLPVLPEKGPLGGHVLSHDQIEAVLMRRAGYEVRVLPEEDLGWEENPPTLLEFIRRDLRWCQGNMQYWHFLTLPGLKLGQPLSARVRDPDVSRLPGLDGPAGARHHRRGARRRPSDFIRADSRPAAVRPPCWSCGSRRRSRPSIDVLLRPEARAGFGGTPRFLVERRRRDGVLRAAARRSCGSATRCSSPPAVRRRRRLERTGARRSRGAARRSRCGSCGRRPVLGVACLGVLAATVPAAIPTRC